MKEKAPSSKAPLENPAAERALLGALIRNTTTFWTVKDRATPGLFAVDRNQLVVKTMHFLVENDRSLSMAAVIGNMPFASDWSVEGYLAALAADAADPDEVPDLINDLAGMQARREMIRFADALMQEATNPEGDPVTRLESAKASVSEIGDAFTEQVQHVSQISERILARVGRAYQANVVTGLPVGLKGVQDLIGPLLGGRLYLLCGSPGSGKSALMAQMAETIAATDPVMIEQIEMPDEEQVERLLAPRAGLAADKIERAALDEEEFGRLADAAAAIQGLKLWIDGSTSPSIAQITSRAMRMKRQHGLVALFIDHLLYIATPPGRQFKAEHEIIRFNLQGLKRLAKRLQIPVVCLTQPTKDYTSGPIRRPKVADMYGGAANEQEADVILLLYRKEYMLRRAEPDTGESSKEHVEWRSALADCEGKAEAILGKRRGGKGFGIRTLYFEGESMRFSDNMRNTYADIRQGNLLSDDQLIARG